MKTILLIVIGSLLLVLTGCAGNCTRDVVISIKDGVLGATPAHITTGKCKKLEVRFKADPGVQWRVDFVDPTPCDGNVKTFENGSTPASCKISDVQNVKDKLQFTVSSGTKPPVVVFVCRGDSCGS